MKQVPQYYDGTTDDTSGVRTEMLEMFVIEKTAIRKLQVPNESPIFERVRSTVCYILINENTFTQPRLHRKAYSVYYLGQLGESCIITPTLSL